MFKKGDVIRRKLEHYDKWWYAVTKNKPTIMVTAKYDSSEEYSSLVEFNLYDRDVTSYSYKMVLCNKKNVHIKRVKSHV